jgi:hypothetical protein
MQLILLMHHELSSSVGPRAIFTSYNNGNETSTTSSAFMSPVFRSSHLSYGQCLRFRYVIYGSRTRVLRVFQHLKVGTYEKRLIWTVNKSNYTDDGWYYGEASISGALEYKVIISLLICNYARYSDVSCFLSLTCQPEIDWLM